MTGKKRSRKRDKRKRRKKKQEKAMLKGKKKYEINKSEDVFRIF